MAGIEEKLVLTFQSVNFAMQAESVFKSEGMDLKIIPTPREISSSCGLSVMTDPSLLDKTKELDQAGRIKVSNYWKYTKDEDGKKEASKID